MDEKKESVLRVVKRCPICHKRCCDKISAQASGIIEMKCPHCGSIVTINLAFRKARLYRRAS